MESKDGKSRGLGGAEKRKNLFSQKVSLVRIEA